MAEAAPDRSNVETLQTSLDEQRRTVFVDSSVLEERRVLHALHKLESGTFGNCLICGEPIDREMLAEAPWAKRCGECREPAPILLFQAPKHIEAGEPTGAQEPAA